MYFFDKTRKKYNYSPRKLYLIREFQKKYNFGSKIPTLTLQTQCLRCFAAQKGVLFPIFSDLVQFGRGPVYNPCMERHRYIEELTRRQAKLTSLISAIEQRLPGYPEGKLRIQHNKRTSSYYIVEEGKNDNGMLLKKSDRKLAVELAQKSYYQKVLKAAKEEQKLISRFLQRLPDPTYEEVYQALPELRQELITPVFLTDEEFVSRWLALPYNRKGFSDGTPFYETMNGERVRSKSEMIIADHLKAKNIPYKYECPLVVGNRVWHPDFTILRLSDRSEIYLEHLGKMGDPGYTADNLDKLNKYALDGFITGETLFVTMESADCPLDVRALDKLIESKFR